MGVDGLWMVLYSPEWKERKKEGLKKECIKDEILFAFSKDV